MRKSVIYVMSAVCLLMIASVVAACTAGEPATQTVTQPVIMTEYVTITPTPVTVTVTRAPGTPVNLEGPAGTPHSIFNQGAGFGGCFSCHPIPPYHEGRNVQEEVCLECHYELPRDQWKTSW